MLSILPYHTENQEAEISWPVAAPPPSQPLLPDVDV